MPLYSNGTGQEIDHPAGPVITQHHHEQLPTHVAYPQYPPHIAYQYPPPPHPNAYHPRHAEIAGYPGQPMMYGHPMHGHPINGDHHSMTTVAHDGSHTGRPSSRKSQNIVSPAVTLASLDGSLGRKLSVASSNGHTPPAAGPSTQRQPGSTASTKKANGSVPKKRGRPPKVKTAEVTPSRPGAADASGDSAQRQAKRARITAPPPMTPPPTGIVPLSFHDKVTTLPPIDDEDPEDERRRKTLAITKHETDGRRLDCNQEYVDRPDFSASRQRGPGLVMDDKGTASFDAGEAVSQELNWMESSLASPPLTAEAGAATKTPLMEPAPMPDIEVTHTPTTRASNLEKRMQGFKSLSARPQAAEARFVEGGRFITPGPGLTDLLMNPTHGQPVQNGSDDKLGSITQPDWPEIPGSIAWPHQDPIREGNRRRELASIEKYLALGESDSDEETPERFHIHIRRPVSAVAGPSNHSAGRGRGVALIDGAPSDALLALKLTMRNRTFDHLETSSLACDCGNQYDVEQVTVQCTNCRDIHHAACYPARDLPTNQWETFFCRACRERAMRHATPVQTPRAYAQSDIRSSAFKGDMARGAEMAGIALMPSPIFPITTRTPYGQLMGRAQSPRGPVHNRTLSFNDDPFFKYFEVPTTPAPAGPRTPRDAGGSGFDVMSTPSRHLDYSSLVRYPRPSDSRDRTMMSDSMGSFSTPLSSRVTSASGSAVRPMMMGSKPSMTPSVSITGPSTSTSSLTAGPSSSGHAGRPDIGIGSPPSTLGHQLLGGALIMSPPTSYRQRQVSKNNLSSLDVDSRGDLMGPMIDAAELHDDER
jgi:hypothetical protein